MSSNEQHVAGGAGIEEDNDYVSRSGEEGGIPVVSDNKVESGIDSRTADSDEQLARDDKDAIDQSNVIEERTRNAGPEGGYREPGDDEGLPGPEDGTSSNN